LAKNEPLKDAIEPSRYLDIGNLLLAFTILWTYMSFSQFLIIWSGNLKQEIPFYMTRAFGGWGVFGGLLLLFHFFVPFFALLQRSVKRRLPRLAKVALLQLVMTVVDLYWQVFPSFQSGPRFSDLTVLAAVLGLGGLWVAVFLSNLKRLPLLPAHDPRFLGRSPAIPPVSEFLHVHAKRPEAS
jgi:cytochrome c biogenesis factor